MSESKMSDVEKLNKQKEKIKAEIKQLENKKMELINLGRVEANIKKVRDSNHNLMNLRNKYLVFEENGYLSNVCDSYQKVENGYCIKVTDLDKVGINKENPVKAMYSKPWSRILSEQEQENRRQSDQTSWCGQCGKDGYEHIKRQGSGSVTGKFSGVDVYKCRYCQREKSERCDED